MTTRPGLVDGRCSTSHLTPIDFGDHDRRVLCRDFYETEATHLSGIEVSNKIHGLDMAMLTE
jgi:hypothetical protein